MKQTFKAGNFIRGSFFCVTASTIILTTPVKSGKVQHITSISAILIADLMLTECPAINYLDIEAMTPQKAVAVLAVKLRITRLRMVDFSVQ